MNFDDFDSGNEFEKISRKNKREKGKKGKGKKRHYLDNDEAPQDKKLNARKQRRQRIEIPEEE
jgi:hypothetical protein